MPRSNKTTPRDPEELATELLGLHSNGAYWAWRDACDKANAECAEIDAAERELAQLEARVIEARQHTAALRQAHEPALSRRERVLRLYETLQSRLKFPTGLPSEVAASASPVTTAAR